MVASEKSKVRDPVDLFSGGVVGHSSIERVHTNAHSAETAPGIRTDIACLNLGPDDVLILAIPPQSFGAFSSDTPCVHHHRGLVISVMAGIRIAK